MKTFFASFAGCTAALAVVAVAGSIVMQPYYALTIVAAHSIVGGPGEANRLLLDIDRSLSQEEANKIVMRIYSHYWMVKQAPMSLTK